VGDYTRVNILEVENVAPRFGLPAEIEARFPRRRLGCRTGAVAHFRLGPNVRAPFGHRHTEQEELYVVVAGSGRAKVDDEIVEVGAWDVIRVAPETMRAFEAGPEGLEYLAYGAPIGDERDSEIVPGWWE
jgi:mannose-6-phosphate isomerase-like protein (cupin superfamily)